jgi:hypothetical protein
MTDFKQGLLEFAGPRLRAVGYEYDDALRDRDLTYGFRKPLGGDVHALILFQRQQYEERPRGLGFTINLIRCKTSDPAQWHLGGYEGFLNQRLSAVLWLVYGLRIYSNIDHWWIPVREEEIETQFADALDKLEKYGIPWLKDPKSKIPGIPDARLAEFREALSKIVSPILQQFGYRAMDSKEHPFCFGRKVFDDLTAFIIFRLSGSPPGFERLVFYIDLFRNRGSEPRYDFGQGYEGVLSLSLGGLLWKKAGLRIGPYRYVDWEYSSREELENQLEDAAEKIKDYAIPCLETPTSGAF